MKDTHFQPSTGHRDEVCNLPNKGIHPMKIGEGQYYPKTSYLPTLLVMLLFLRRLPSHRFKGVALVERPRFRGMAGRLKPRSGLKITFTMAMTMIHIHHLMNVSPYYRGT
jgi:hypothetical protein